jgi:hypothetical protein
MFFHFVSLSFRLYHSLLYMIEQEKLSQRKRRRGIELYGMI